MAEFERATNAAITTSVVPAVQYVRGPDMGGGVGGLLFTVRSPLGSTGWPAPATTAKPLTLRHNLSNGRGDIVAQSDSSGALTWTASYEAYGKRTKETGTNADKQRANTKDEDPTGLLNEGFRYRDIETGVWLSRDPAGFVDGPNLYAYVMQNPWTAWDPDGLAARVYIHDPKEYDRVKKLEGKGLYQGAEIRKGFRTKSDGSVVKWRPTGVVAESNKNGGFHLFDIQQNYDSATWMFDNKEHAQAIKGWHDYLGLASALTGFSGLGRGMLSRVPTAPSTILRPPPTKKPGSLSPVSTAAETADDGFAQVSAELQPPPPSVEMAKQGKHIPDHKNYIPGKSPFTHTDPQGLVDKFSGKGQPVGKIPRGQPSFKERVDFGEVIGEFEGKETTRGIIHYSKNGVHIVPSNPN